jgi:hypothetical protein
VDVPIAERSLSFPKRVWLACILLWCPTGTNSGMERSNPRGYRQGATRSFGGDVLFRKNTFGNKTYVLSLGCTQTVKRRVLFVGRKIDLLCRLDVRVKSRVPKHERVPVVQISGRWELVLLGNHYSSGSSIDHDTARPRCQINPLRLCRDLSRQADSPDQSCLARHHPKKIHDGRYELTFTYGRCASGQEIYDLIQEIHNESDLHSCFAEPCVMEKGADRSWC